MADRRDKNGWRDGRDPAQRWLRIGATVVFTGVFTAIALDSTRTEDFPKLVLALAAALVLMGYETIVRIPGIWQGKERPPDD